MRQKIARHEVPAHPVEFLTEADIAALPELPMTQAEDGSYYCDGESTQFTTTGAQLFDASRISDTEEGGATLTNNGDGSFTVSGSGALSASFGSFITLTHDEVLNLFKVGTLYLDVENIKTPRFYVQFLIDNSVVEQMESYGIAKQLEITQEYLDNELFEIRFFLYGTTNQEITPMTVKPMVYQSGDGTWEPYTGGQPSPNPDYPQPIVNTYPAGTYKAVCGDKIYKVVLDDDLRSVPGVADRVRIDADRGMCWVERKVSYAENIQFILRKNYSFDDSKLFVSSLTFEDIPIKKTFSTGQCMSNVLQNKACATSNITAFYAGFGRIFARIVGITDVDEFNEKMNGSYFMYPKSTPTTRHSIPTQLTTVSSGKSATIENTVNDKADFLAVKGDSWQLQQEQGKNLLKLNDGEYSILGVAVTIKNGEITIKGTATADGGKNYRLGFASLKAGTTYFFSADYERCIISKSSDNSTMYYPGVSFTAEEDLDIYVGINVVKGTEYDKTFIPQIEVGGVGTTPEPFQPAMPSPEYPSEILSVEGEMQSSGWNLFDVEKAKDITNWINSTVQKGYADFPIYVGKGNNFTVSYDGQLDLGLNFYTGIVLGKDANVERWMYHSMLGTQIRNLYSGIAREDCIWIRCNKSGIPLMIKYFQNLQISISNSKMLYDLHRGNSITLPTLRGLPDGTRDVLYVDRKNQRAWIERNVGVAVFDGSEACYKRTDVDNAYNYNNIKNKNASFKIYCSAYKQVYTVGGLKHGCFYAGTTKISFCNDNATTVEEWKTWLASNPITVQYALATPVIEELPYSDYLLETCQYQTNLHIDCDENLTPEIELTCKILGR